MEQGEAMSSRKLMLAGESDSLIKSMSHEEGEKDCRTRV